MIPNALACTVVSSRAMQRLIGGGGEWPGDEAINGIQTLYLFFFISRFLSGRFECYVAVSVLFTHINNTLPSVGIPPPYNTSQLYIYYIYTNTN